MTPIHRHGRGFTLIEVVIALTLVAVILTGLISALVSFGKTSTRLEERSLASDDVRLVYAFLEQSLGVAAPQVRVRPEDSVPESWFEGTGTELEWLGLMPARHGVGGLYHFRLTLERGAGGGRRLILYYLPYVGDDPQVDWGFAVSHLLLEGVTGLDLAYRALDEDEWRAEWRQPEVLPARVKVGLAVRGQAWPELIVQILEAQPRSDINRPEQEQEQ
jgi:general secretion pathway protein J